MRIIAGAFKGRTIKAVPGHMTRPTGDKIKESAFQMIGPFFAGGICLDLFAGSGNLGIEALSRGIDRSVFVDRYPKAIQTIKKNIDTLQVKERTSVFRMDALRAIRYFSKHGMTFDLIFIDPPYEKVDYKNYLQAIIQYELLNERGWIVCEHAPSLLLDDLTEEMTIYKQQTYNATTAITIYKHQ